jgi:hypothetical protein
MINAWNVQWNDGEKLVRKVFEGDSPKDSGAVSFAKELRGRGLSVDIISRRHGFPPPVKMREPPRMGMLWCPYCIKWREFEVIAISHEGFTTPDLLRCPVCTISIMDYHVRTYNVEFVERYLTAQDMRKRPTTPEPQGKRRRRVVRA